MPDREKVIKGIHQHCEGSMFDRCGECPYYEIDHEPFVCRDMLLNDLNELLKEQETDIGNLNETVKNLLNAYTEIKAIYGDGARVVGELVRCKDCKHRGDSEKCVLSAISEEKDFPLFMLDNRGEWFCADGERR